MGTSEFNAIGNTAGETECWPDGPLGSLTDQILSRAQ